jgi:choline-glycine betaine transporter
LREGRRAIISFVPFIIILLYMRLGIFIILVQESASLARAGKRRRLASSELFCKDSPWTADMVEQN